MTNRKFGVDVKVNALQSRVGKIVSRKQMAARLLKGVALVCALSSLSACGLMESRYAKDEERNRQRSADALAAIRKEQPRPAYAVEDTRDFVASRSVPLSRDAALPDSIARVTFRFPGRLTLATIAERISREVGIPVVLTPDALMDPMAFQPGGGGASTAAAVKPAVSGGESAAGRPATFGTDDTTASLSLSNADYRKDYELNYSGSFAGLLDYVAARASLQWKYEDGRIVFYRLQTRSFTIKSLSNAFKISANLGSSGSSGGSGGSGGGGGGGGGGSGSSPLTGTLDLEGDFWAGMEKNLQAMLSRSGKVTVDKLSGVVIVMDSAEAMSMIERYVDQINKLMMRQVAMDVEVLVVDHTEANQVGIDWNLFYKSLSDPGDNVTLSGPNVVGPAKTPYSFTFNKTRFGTVAIKMLENFGHVSTAYSGVVTTSNRIPVPVAVLSNQAYVAQTTPAAVVSSAGGLPIAGTPGLTPGQISTGFSLVVQPMLLDSNQLLLQCVLSMTTLKELADFESGTGATAQKIQLPNIDAFSAVQRLVVPTGETMVLMGYEQTQNAFKTAGLLESVTTSKAAGRSRKSVVILVTPRVADI